MAHDEMARKATAINYEIVITHGAQGGVGFVWQETFIHNPFVDPQYGAFEVDPVQQYGDAYLQSIFVTDPATALEMARRQLRDEAGEDLSRYCQDHRLDAGEASAVVEAVCGVRVSNPANPLEPLTDEEVVKVWAHVSEAQEVAE